MVLVAGVDSSTQSCKVLLVDAETGAVVTSAKVAHPEGTEVDPEAWWQAFIAATASLDGFDDIAAIAIAGQQHGMVVLDAQGAVIRPALLWNDTRSAAAAEQLAAEFPDIVARTGSRPVASFTAAKLRWLRDAEPRHAARVAAVALPHDWLTWRVRGFGPDRPDLGALITDRSDASGTSYWGAHGYDRELLVAALGHDAILPSVLDAATGVRDGGRVVGAGMGDNSGAALGLGARPGDVVVSIGTSGTIFAVADRPVFDESGMVAGFADATGHWLPLVATLNAARVLDAVAGLLGVDHAELGALALAAEPGSGGLVLQPYFEGERTPNRPDATATLFGMTLASSTRANVARAAIEGMLCGLADGLDALRAHGVSAQRILLTGGAAQNEAVQRIAAQVFDVPVEVPEPAEYVAYGAAVQAAWALTGERPRWQPRIIARPEVDTRPIIRAQYAAR